MSAATNTEMTIRFRGVRGSLPAPAAENMRYGGNTSCVEVRSGEQLLILDAGSGIRALGEELVRTKAGEPIEATLLLSHTHWDHIQGLPFFSPGYPLQNHIEVFGACGRALHLQRALANQMSPYHFPVGLEQMRGLSLVDELSPEVTELGNFLIRTTPLNHPGGCAGFRIEGAAGKFAYLPDHEPYQKGSAQNGTLIEFLRDLEILILDTQYTTNEYAERVGWGHGCLANSVELAIEAGVRRLFLFHHDPSHNDQQIDQMVESARALASGSSLTINAASENEPISLVQSSFDCPSEIGMSDARPWQYPGSQEGAAFSENPLHQRH